MHRGGSILLCVSMCVFAYKRRTVIIGGGGPLTGHNHRHLTASVMFYDRAKAKVKALKYKSKSKHGASVALWMEGYRACNTANSQHT